MLHNKLIFFAVLSFCFLLGFSDLSANEAKQQELEQLERSIKSQEEKAGDLAAKARQAEAEMKALRRELISLSQSVQQREASVTRIEETLATVRREEKLARDSLEKRHSQSVETLMAVQRMALNPPEAIIAMPQAPADMVRSAILLRSIVPEIQSQAEQLRKQVADYSQKRTLLEEQKERLSLANRDLDEERARLSALMREKEKLGEQFAEESDSAKRQARQMAAQAKDLRALIDQLAKAKAKRDEEERLSREARLKALEKVPQKPSAPTQKAEPGDEESANEIVLGQPPTSKPIAQAKGALNRPASGPVVQTFGSKEELGGTHKGITIATRNQAQIVATYDGQVAFAGPFRGYRQLLIIDHGDGYHTLLTGMDRLDVAEGQWLLGGEPVGVMASGGSERTKLYFELRNKGVPVNPLPWIRRQSTKAQG